MEARSDRRVLCFSGVDVETGHAVDELWQHATDRFPTSMSALLASFDGDLDRAKQVMRDATASSKDSTSKNDLTQQLVNIGGDRKKRVEGTMALLRAMVEQPDMGKVIQALLQVRDVERLFFTENGNIQ